MLKSSAMIFGGLGLRSMRSTFSDVLNTMVVKDSSMCFSISMSDWRPGRGVFFWNRIFCSVPVRSPSLRFAYFLYRCF